MRVHSTNRLAARLAMADKERQKKTLAAFWSRLKAEPNPAFRHLRRRVHITEWAEFAADLIHQGKPPPWTPFEDLPAYADHRLPEYSEQ